jgi:hypothetical protein
MSWLLALASVLLFAAGGLAACTVAGLLLGLAVVLAADPTEEH